MNLAQPELNNSVILTLQYQWRYCISKKIIVGLIGNLDLKNINDAGEAS